MLTKRGCHQPVYPQNNTGATGEPSNFASALIFLLLLYKGARTCRVVERSYKFAGKNSVFTASMCIYQRRRTSVKSRFSLSRHREGRCSALSRATPCEAGKRRQKEARGMAQNAFSIQAFEAKRVRVESTRCTGYLDHPFKNKHVQTGKDRRSLL